MRSIDGHPTWSTGTVTGRIVFVEDSLARAGEITRLLDLFRSGGAVRSGKKVSRLVIADEEFWDPVTALARITGDTPVGQEPGPNAQRWDSSDQLFMDCWDRDALDERSPTRSTFFALDLLRGLQGVAEAGFAVPRVIVHSRGMSDDLLRAALSEFLSARIRIRVPDESPVIRWRRDLRSEALGSGALWAMFDRSALERNLDLVLGGDRSAALGEPGTASPVWEQIAPTSCLGSFHCALRDECPDIWERFIIDRGDTAPTVDGAAVARITRVAKRYLELQTTWGTRGYRGYLAIARALANPGL